MKKILLSCVTCLLALGLVTACNNDDEVENDGTVNPPSETTEDGTDTDGETGEGGGTTQAVTLSNYTLSFNFTGEEIPEYAALYINGDFNNWTFDALTETDGAYTITLSSISVGEHEYKVVMWYDDEVVSWSNCVEIVKGSGTSNATFTVDASQGDGFKLEIETELTETLGEKAVIENYVLSFTFVKDGESVTLEGLDLYIAGDWSGDVWELEKCTETSGVYSLTIASIFAGTHYYQGLTIEKDYVPTGWDDCDKLITDGNGGNASLVVSEEDNGAQTIEIDLTETEVEGVHFYVAFIDNSVDTWSNAEPVQSLDGSFYFEASAYTTEDSAYTRVNNPNIWSGANYCDATQVTSTDGHMILYSEEAIGNAEDELWIDVNNGEHWMNQGDNATVNIPTDDTKTYVCVIPAWFYGWLGSTDTTWSGASINWHTLEVGQTIENFVSALTLDTAIVTA